MFRSITRYFGNLLLLSGVVTLWYAVGKTINFLNNPSIEKDVDDRASSQKSKSNSINSSMTSIIQTKTEFNVWTVVYSKYQEIRTLSQLINKALGSVVTLSLARAILYNSANMDDVLFSPKIPGRILLVLLMINDGVTFFLAANICVQMESFKVWLSNDGNRKHAPYDQMFIVLNDVNTATIGIRGSNIFTISHSLLWNVLTSVVTFFIMCLQSRIGNDTSLVAG
ncbi:unnamed protein product [Orchesella dallaii]|uniref:Uncharacterized protein n=1 Tax=Orchesella dallaii TaxID=48710 RepID=A0ABP1PP32_9HEXA